LSRARGADLANDTKGYSRLRANARILRVKQKNLSIAMTSYTIRRLLVDVDAQVPRHWAGGDAFKTAVLDALSMSFPRGEQYFIDSLKAGAECLDPQAQQAFAQELKGFIGQEATHRHIHARFNRQLTEMGYDNGLDRRLERRIQRMAHLNVRRHVAATAATEHITALLASWLLRRPDVLRDAPPALSAMWLWHSTEEIEHRSTAFDLYRAIGGHESGRRQTFWLVSMHFLIDVALQVGNNLWRDGSWKRPSTWRNGWRLLFERDGLIRGNRKGWAAYLKPDFHPSQHDDTAARVWLAHHSDLWRPVNASAPTT
jgi:uncharacterized protein